jgi:hypothetical protein
LRERTYAPADALLASYHQQHRRPAMLFEQEFQTAAVRNVPAGRRFNSSRMKSSGSALVIVTLMFVPLMGILFCPCAVMWGMVNFRRTPLAARAGSGTTRLAVFTIVCGILVFGAQSFLWVLYLLMD